MRVLFISRATLFSVKGGDTIQMQKTAEGLKTLGIDADIKLCNDTAIDYSQYKLIHFFNIIRPADCIYHIHKSRLPYVVSTIYVDYSAYENYSKKSRGVTGWLLGLLGRNSREYIKAIARMVVNGEKIISSEYLLWGHHCSVKYVLSNAAMLLPNSESEYQRLQKHYKTATPYSVVYNAADTAMFNCLPDTIASKHSQMVLCVGRIEGRKNQLNLIRALNGSEFQLYIIGNYAPNHKAYYEACRNEAADNIHFVNDIEQNQLLNYYRNAKVHVLPSWFETTGLSSLEALFCGCIPVVTNYGDTKEYFNSSVAFYCDPASSSDILDKVKAASVAVVNMNEVKNAMQRFNWQATAVATAETYKQAITTS
ncbi:MAG: glycosyltransferase family 4 protein [Bacteroidota bacterium]